MKSVFLILFMFAAGSPMCHASADKLNGKSICKNVFESNVYKIYEETNAESVRMSKRVTVHSYKSKEKNLELFEISANFYVKWPANSSEVPELAGGRFVFESEAKKCRSVGIVEFAELKSSAD